ncbi:hypothetical protein WR25_23299 isoform D [Diploscapter pachys]|nr:hypothetical protein WR25_23299 isoform D [Diploscapter pachys]
MLRYAKILRNLHNCVPSCSSYAQMQPSRRLSTANESPSGDQLDYTHFLVDPGTVKIEDLKPTEEFVKGLDGKLLHKFEQALAELELFVAFGSMVPSSISDFEWKRCLSTDTLEARIDFWEYLAKRQASKAHRLHVLGKERTIQNQIKQMHEHEQRRIYEAGGMGYGPDAYEPFLNPLRDSSMDVILSSARLANSMILKNPRIIIDMRPFATAKERDIIKIAISFRNVIGGNFHSMNPLPLSIAGMPRTPQTKEFLEKRVNVFGSRYEHLKIFPDISDLPPEQLGDFKQEDIAYISPHAKELIDGPLDRKAYVILGCPDENLDSLALSRKSGIDCYCLPIKKYFIWRKGSVKPHPHYVANVLREVNVHGDWKLAIRNTFPE